MISATRSYEANVTAIRATKEMASDALDIGRYLENVRHQSNTIRRYVAGNSTYCTGIAG